MTPKKLTKHLSSLSPSELFESMCKFYKEIRFIEFSGPESDMLLYQFGVFDWGQGELFELDITRQFINDEDEVSQLSATLYFEPVSELKKLEEKSVWCQSLSQLEDFEAEIQGSEAYKICRNLVPSKMRVNFEAL